jgi:membrane protease YdiL (CAAX protease family)
LADYGVTTADRSVRQHLLIGVLVFAAAGLPSLGLKFLAEVLPLGGSPQHWELTRSLDTPGIWLYLFVGSFGLVPILEELFARGYVQSRLAEDFGAPAAILITAIFFTFSHTQYFIAGALGIGMLLSLFAASVVAGYVRHRTGSVLAGIVAHALGNLPFLFVLFRWRTIVTYGNRIRREVLVRDAFAGAAQGTVVLIVLLALVMFAPRLLPAFAGVALTLALTLESRDRRPQRVA